MERSKFRRSRALCFRWCGPRISWHRPTGPAVAHAYAGEPDVPSSPEILAALLDEGADRQGRALVDLHNVVHHQGGIFSATAPAVLFVVAVLDDQRTLTPVLPDMVSGASRWRFESPCWAG
jgi:hypothetical protein